MSTKQHRAARMWDLFAGAELAQAQDWTERLGGLQSRHVVMLAQRAIRERRADMLVKLTGHAAARVTLDQGIF
jgi:hypothetical protein